MARATSLTDELREAIERELATGASQAVVRQRTGVSERSLRRWLREGKVVKREPDAPPPIDESLPLSERLARAEPGLVATLIAAAGRGEWRPAAWLLERAWPERWSRREAEPVPLAPRGDDPFREVDELAARRRAR